MKNYRVLIAFGYHAENDTILLNDRQAKFLLLSGHIALVAETSVAVAETQAKPAKAKADV